MDARIVRGFYTALALVYLLMLVMSPYPGDFLLKVLPILCLLAAVLRAGGGSVRRLIAVALIFCGIGDISLALGHFVPGLVAFLLGHLFYLAAFGRDFAPSIGKWLGVAGLLVFAAFMLHYLQPHLGTMAVAVYLYMLVITAMAVAALMGGANHPLVAAGAVLFVLSDSLIAINRFVAPVPAGATAIMVLYYLAQYLLTHDARQPATSNRVL
jgi:alkenylglycerophosphocholine/alkenylglycerophosphoethanolamine hydrolase